MKNRLCSQCYLPMNEFLEISSGGIFSSSTIKVHKKCAQKLDERDTKAMNLLLNGMNKLVLWTAATIVGVVILTIAISLIHW